MERTLHTPHLVLIPVPIAEEAWNTLPSAVQSTLLSTYYLMAENARTLRRMIKNLHPAARLEDWHIVELDKHRPEQTDLLWFTERRSFGLVSESGCPGIADPGAEIVRLAHERGYRVMPLVGPSSLILALMASGLPGQHFEFHGYLPVKKDQLNQAIQKLIQQLQKSIKTQLFIEAPYRNMALFEHLLQQVPGHFRLCVASRLTAPDEYVKTLTISQWKSGSPPAIDKKECVFLLAR